MKYSLLSALSPEQVSQVTVETFTISVLTAVCSYMGRVTPVSELVPASFQNPLSRLLVAMTLGEAQDLCNMRAH